MGSKKRSHRGRVVKESTYANIHHLEKRQSDGQVTANNGRGWQAPKSLRLPKRGELCPYRKLLCMPPIRIHNSAVGLDDTDCRRQISVQADLETRTTPEGESFRRILEIHSDMARVFMEINKESGYRYFPKDMQPETDGRLYFVIKKAMYGLFESGRVRVSKLACKYADLTSTVRIVQPNCTVVNANRRHAKVLAVGA